VWTSIVEENQHSEDDAEKIHYNIQFSLDKDGFFRRACSHCGLHFKTQVQPDDFGYLLAPAFRQVEQEYQQTLEVNGTTVSQDAVINLTCPYCGVVDNAQHMLTEEFFEYIRKWLMREIILPKVTNIFRDVGSNGLFQVTIPPSPVAPLSGPELPDMVRVHLLCCHEEIKIFDEWLDTIHCPYCSQQLLLQ
jgi:hypothetical protein